MPTDLQRGDGMHDRLEANQGKLAAGIGDGVGSQLNDDAAGIAQGPAVVIAELGCIAHTVEQLEYDRKRTGSLPVAQPATVESEKDIAVAFGLWRARMWPRFENSD